MLTHQFVDVEREGDAVVLTMNRPDRRNALSLEMMRELDRALAQTAERTEVRAVILRAKGPAFRRATICANCWTGTSKRTARSSTLASV